MSGRYSSPILVVSLTIPTEVFLFYPQSLHAKAGILTFNHDPLYHSESLATNQSSLCGLVSVNNTSILCWVSPFASPQKIQIKTFTAIILPLVLYWHETWPFVEGGTQAEGV